MSEAAAALGISPAALTGDHEAGVYSSHRQTRIDDVLQYQTEQAMVKGLLWKLWRRWSDAQRMRGLTVEDRWLQKITMQTHPGIDPNKDAAFYDKMINLSLMSREDIAAGLGKDWLTEVWPELEEEMKAMGQVVDDADAAVEGVPA